MLELLTKREMEVLKLLAEGLSDKEIAKELNIQVSTSHAHVHHILLKLKVVSRLVAAIIYDQERQIGQK